MNQILIFSILSNGFIILLNHHGLLDDAAGLFWTFNGLVVAINLWILNRGLKYGLFKR